MGKKKIEFNPLSGNFDYVTLDGYIPQLNADPASPVPETAWVRKTGGGGTGGGTYKATLGLGFPYLSPNTGGSFAYELSYRTVEGTTKRVTMS